MMSKGQFLATMCQTCAGEPFPGAWIGRIPEELPRPLWSLSFVARGGRTWDFAETRTHQPLNSGALALYGDRRIHRSFNAQLQRERADK